MSTLNATADFMRAAGQEIPAAPTIPNVATAGLRVALLREELSELEQAFFEGDKVAVLDALADLQVVLDGAVLACGMQDVFPAAMAEVSRSNMSKFCSTVKMAIDTLAHYEQQGVPAVALGREGGRYVIVRSADDKVLKSVNYSPANLAPLL